MIITKKELFPLLKSLIPHATIIVEAGAFDGKDTQKLSYLWPQAAIHTFEPVPEIFSLLSENTKSLAHVKNHRAALSSHSGTQLFYTAEHPKKPGQPCQAGSLLKPKDRLLWSAITYPGTITVPTITLQDWLNQEKLTRIDVLWLDVQGNELPILQTAEQILPSISLIYTEVSFIDAYENQAHYKEVKEWLEQRGYKEYARDFQDQTSWFFGNTLFFRE